MARQLQVAAHLSSEELEARYRTAVEPVQRSHYQAIWLLARGYSAAQVADVTGYHRNWIYQLRRRYNQSGPPELDDQRHHNRGQKPMLTEFQLALLWQAIEEPHPDGGLWNGPKVAQWMSELLERPVHPQRGWDYLKRLEMTRRRPRPAHVNSSVEEQETWKKN
ncbi:MAG: winged helix-turn-helix domain-containing protein [Cyanobacteria bacterium P01_C01_bin.89]